MIFNKGFARHCALYLINNVGDAVPVPKDPTLVNVPTDEKNFWNDRLESFLVSARVYRSELGICERAYCHGFNVDLDVRFELLKIGAD